MENQMRHYSDLSISSELMEQYRTLSMEKRLEWLYLGNVLRKAFSEMMDKHFTGEQEEG